MCMEHIVYTCTYVYVLPTETGGVLISPRPSPDNHTPKPGFPMRPFYGIEPVLVDEKVWGGKYMYMYM